MSHYYVKAADLEDVDICVLIPEYFIHMALKRRKIYLEKMVPKVPYVVSSAVGLYG